MDNLIYIDLYLDSWGRKKIKEEEERERNRRGGKARYIT